MRRQGSLNAESPGVLFYFGMLVGSVASALIARARGYSMLLYGGAGLLLNLGAIPLVLLFTATPSALSVERELGLTSVRPTQPASAALCAWMAYYQGFRQALLLTSLSGVALLVVSLLGFIVRVMPQFVIYYEGMSLALPVPTQVAIAICRFFRSDLVQGALWVADLVGPWLCCRYLLSGYRIPLFGAVWRHADQIWLLLAAESANVHLPDEVQHRLSGAPSSQDGLECHRDRLQGALWTASMAFLPLLAGFVLVLTFLLLGLLLPLCGGGCVGNIGT